MRRIAGAAVGDFLPLSARERRPYNRSDGNWGSELSIVLAGISPDFS
jgi:hypothetical protein